MVNGIAIDLFDFQEKAVIKLLDIVTDSRSKQTITVKSPTGSGKTIILIDFVEEYLTKINSRTAKSQTDSAYDDGAQTFSFSVGSVLPNHPCQDKAR